MARALDATSMPVLDARHPLGVDGEHHVAKYRGAAAHSIDDLRVPPANRLEKLKGKLAGLRSIRVNDQYRVVFRFDTGNAHDVTVTDYH